MPQLRTPRAARPIEPARTRAPRRTPSLPFLSHQRIRSNIRLVLEDGALLGTPAYGLAIQAEYLLEVVEGKRLAAPRTRVKGKRQHKWGREGRAELLADERTPVQLAEAYGVSVPAIRQQLLIARKEAAA